MTPELRSIPLASLVLSKTPAQVERRAHFDQGALGKLADSIKAVGILQPIVARPVNGGKIFEVVAGERRVAAAGLAGLAEISASVRDLTDEQVLEVQLVENLQREDLHELAQAEGYEQLQKLGWDVERIAENVGTSKATVYARMKLLALCQAARKAFYDAKLSASHALLLARIPVESLQKEALKEILDGGEWGDEAMSYREAQQLIQQQYMLRLDRAPFPTTDAQLVPAAGPCGSCPKNTARQPELFADVSKKAHCTDPVCFKQKQDAHIAREVAAAEASGRKVVAGAEAKKILPYGEHSASGGYALPGDRCYEDPKQRTYRELAGKEVEPVLVKAPKTGAIVEVYPKAPVHKARGFRPQRTPSNRSGSELARDRKVKRENEFRRLLFKQVLEKAPARLGRAELVPIALAFFRDIWHEHRKAIVKGWGWDDGKGDPDHIAKRKLAELTEADVARFVFCLTFARELHVGPYDSSQATQLIAAAQRLKLSPEKIRRELAAAEKAKTAAPAKASKKRKAK